MAGKGGTKEDGRALLQRHVQRCAQARHARDIGVFHRIFQPDDAGLLQGAAGAHRAIDRPRFRRIDHDRDIRSHRVTHRSDSRDLSVRMCFVADPQFHRSESLRHRFARIVRQRIE